MNALTRLPSRGWNLSGDFDDLVNGFFSPISRVNRVDTGVSHLVPAMDIVETESGYVVKTDLPGISKEDLSVSVNDNLLTIEAHRVSDNVEKEGESVIKLERRSGKYYRSLKLGKAVDASLISAEYKDGVLTLKLPRSEQQESQKIDVAVH